ncbi:MAG: hypothetical protein HUU49_03680 [Candidatus Buchananbacteria bacterium]|nr:hypothetical protein [Candidatus Buchananbacteria bacterium]
MAYPMPPKVSKPADMASSRPVGLVASPKTGGGSWFKGFITLIIVLVIIGGGVYLIASYTGVGTGLIPGTSYFQNTWQAVFLTNGQVYFGKVSKIGSDSVVLHDIYYLQVVTQPLQRSQDEPAPTEEEQQQGQQRLTLIKLGNELHGPRDEMIINRDHVILMEDLKEDSRVVQAINDYIANQGENK